MGLFSRTPVVTRTCRIDRVGMAHADSYNLEIWYAMFDGDPTIHRIHASQVRDAAHLVLARPGDEVKVSFKGNGIEEFENLSLGCRADAPTSQASSPET